MQAEHVNADLNRAEGHVNMLTNNTCHATEHSAEHETGHELTRPTLSESPGAPAPTARLLSINADHDHDLISFTPPARRSPLTSTAKDVDKPSLPVTSNVNWGGTIDPELLGREMVNPKVNGHLPLSANKENVPELVGAKVSSAAKWISTTAKKSPAPPKPLSTSELSILTELSHSNKAPAPVDWSLPQGEPPGLTTPLVSPIKKTVPLGGVDTNRRRSGRNREAEGGTSDWTKSIPNSGRWIIDAVNYLRDAFRGFDGSEELIAELMAFEKCMGFQTSKVRTLVAFRIVLNSVYLFTGSER